MLPRGGSKWRSSPAPVEGPRAQEKDSWMCHRPLEIRSPMPELGHLPWRLPQLPRRLCFQQLHHHKRKGVKSNSKKCQQCSKSREYRLQSRQNFHGYLSHSVFHLEWSAGHNGPVRRPAWDPKCNMPFEVRWFQSVTLEAWNGFTSYRPARDSRVFLLVWRNCYQK